MKRLGIIVLLLATGGCGVHLGDKYGRRTRTALDAQISRNDGGSPISGDDAKQVMTRHLGRGQGASAGNPYGSGMPTSSYSSSSSNNAGGVVIRQPTPDSPIRLDAVR